MSSLREINRIVIVQHPSDDDDIGAREIDREHRDQGYLQIRYHLVVRRDGEIDEGRPLARASGSPDAIVIGVVGSEGSHNRAEALRGLLQSLRVSYPEATVEGLPD